MGDDVAPIPSAGGSGVDVVGLLRKSLDNVVQGFKTIGESGSGLFGQANKATADKTTAIQQESGAQQELNNIETARQAELQKRNLETMGMAGALPGAQSKIMQFIQGTVGSKLDTLGKLQSEVEEAKGIGPLDDFGTWLGNAFTRPFKEAKLKQMTEDINENLGIAKAVQDNTSNAMTNNAAATIPDLAAKNAAANKVVAAQAVEKAADARMELTRLGISAAQLALATTTAGFDAIYKLHSAESEDRRLLLEQQKLDETKRFRGLEEGRLELDKQLKEIQIGDKQRQDQAIATFNENLNAVTGPLGLNVKDFFGYQQLSKEAQKAIDDFMINRNMTGGALAKSPAAMLQKMEAVGSVGGTPGMALTTNTLNSWKAGAAIDPRTGQPNFIYNNAKPEVKRAMEDAVIESKAQSEAQNIPSEGGLYSPPPLAATLRGNIVSKLPISKDLEVLAKNPQYPLKPDDIINTAIERIKKGSSVASEANQINTIFKQVTDTLNQSKNYKIFALPELQNTYNMSVIDPRGRHTPLNMLSEPQLRSYLTRRATEQQMYDAGPGGIP